MDNKVIEVFDYLGEKLGIAIDWTSENVMPQVTEFMNRYTKYSIVKCSTNIIIGIVMIAAACILCASIIKAFKADNTDSIWIDSHSWGDELSMLACSAIAFAIVASVAGIAIMITNIFSIIEWAIIPEMKFIETFSQYIK